MMTLQTIAEKLNMENYKTEIRTVVKNGVEFEGLTVIIGDFNPTIYYNENWDNMTDDEVMQIVKNIISVRPNFDSEKLTDPDYILANCEISLQKKGTEQIVKRDYLDLEMYIRVRVSEDATFKLPYNYVSDKFTTDELFDRAMKNIFEKGFIAKGMLALMAEEFGLDLEQMGIPADTKDEQIVVTNANKYMAANALCFPEFFAEICEKNNVNSCYILPSSIHELIVMPNYDDSDANDRNSSRLSKEVLDDMVKSVNAEQVSPEEQLADHCYYFDLNINKITY